MTEENSPIIIGCDHAAYGLKEEIKALLNEKGINVTDVGTHGPESVDYPDYARQVAEAVASGEMDRGILLCGTGLGMSMAANKFANVRGCALYGSVFRGNEPEAQRRQRACSGCPGHRTRAGTGNRQDLAGNAV